MRSDAPPPFVVVEMNASAEALYRRCRDRDEEMLRASDDDPLLEAWGRASEMTKRLALIVACGRRASDRLHGVEVVGDDMEFAARLVDWSVSTFVEGLRQNLAETEHQANANMVLGYIRKAGRITKSDLYRKINKRLDARAIASIISVLAESGEIAIVEEGTTAKGGRPKTAYRWMAG